jgi:hypothetical protein
MVKQENMNPLFLDVANFLIAQDDEQQVVGIGQIRPLGILLAVRAPRRGVREEGTESERKGV